MSEGVMKRTLIWVMVVAMVMVAGCADMQVKTATKDDPFGDEAIRREVAFRDVMVQTFDVPADAELTDIAWDMCMNVYDSIEMGKPSSVWWDELGEEEDAELVEFYLIVLAGATATLCPEVDWYLEADT